MTDQRRCSGRCSARSAEPWEQIATDPERVFFLEVNAHRARPNVDMRQTEFDDRCQPRGALLWRTNHPKGFHGIRIECLLRIELELTRLPVGVTPPRDEVSTSSMTDAASDVKLPENRA